MLILNVFCLLFDDVDADVDVYVIFDVVQRLQFLTQNFAAKNAVTIFKNSSYHF